MHSEDCEACDVIDQIDGIRNGRIFAIDHWKSVSPERKSPFLTRLEQSLARKITNFAGSVKFVYLHLVWFGFWIADNLGWFGSSAIFDRYPFGLLTMIVSLEAIFLSTFVMISQNRQNAQSELRSQTDFESNLQSLIWTVHIAEALNIDIEHVRALCDSAIQEFRDEHGIR